MSDSTSADQIFISTLRDAVGQYFAAVDNWESSYRRYYRMPGGANQSDDLAAERSEFETRRRELLELLPHARSLCFKYGQPDIFTGLPHVTLGQFAPQERTDSAISRGERGAIMACLIELSIGCRAMEAGLPINDDEVRKPSLLERIIAFLG